MRAKQDTKRERENEGGGWGIFLLLGGIRGRSDRHWDEGSV